jgi:hypothetical protein
VEAHARPLDVGLVVGQKPPNEIVWERKSDVRKLEDFPHHQEHDQAPVGVDRNISLQLSFYAHDSFAHSQILHANCLLAYGAIQKNCFAFATKSLVSFSHARYERNSAQPSL